SARFWEAEQLSGFTVTDLAMGVAWSSSDSYASQAGLMTDFLTGTAATQAAAMPEPARIASFQQQLDQVYPEGAVSQTGTATTVSWIDEVYTGGGYAVYKPGQMMRFWPALRAGTPRVRFAGEHLEAPAGYMESAVRSGHRVAQELGAPP
ncbi:MAG TPA: FAD-dependent oxidoreductase, partial [Polyangiaceae bacterium]|nr:FAD-dependent oxidoreductase [Polyangiaceae bacterium]